MIAEAGRTDNATYYRDQPEAATKPILLQPDEIVAAMKQSYEFFINFFMAELLLFPIPPFHIDIFGKMVMTMVKKLVLAIPRGHNKTTLAKLAVVWHFLFTDYSFILYVSSTASIAQAACNDIIAFMRTANFVSTFGGIDFKFDQAIERQGEGFFVFRFQIYGTDTYKTCILRALGAGQQVRGLNVHNKRPEMTVVDDLEDNDNIATEPLQDKLKRWVFGPFLKALNRWKQRILWLGNWLSNTCLLKDLCEDPTWESYRYGCIQKDGTPLWPDMWPLDAIKADFESYVNQNLEDVWFAEMMNMIIPRRDGVIRPNEIYYLHSLDPLTVKYKFITIDPAISDKKWAHKCGIIVHAYNEDEQVWQIVDGVIERGLNPMDIYKKTMELAIKWKVKVIGIEQISYQKALKFFFEHLLAEFGEHDIEVIGVPAGDRKTERISAWSGMIKQKRYALTQGHPICTMLTDQLINFDPRKKSNDDDGIDACAHGEYMMINYIGLIQQKYQEVDGGFGGFVCGAIGHRMAV